MVGQRRNPTPGQWQQQIRAAAPAWNAMRQRQSEAAAAQQQRHQQLWEGFEIGDVVILGAAVTKRSYGLDLCDNNGEAVLMDGVLMSIDGDYARVRIGRKMGKTAPGGGPMVGELQLIRRRDVIRVSEKPATLWRDGANAVKAASARDMKTGWIRRSSM